MASNPDRRNTQDEQVVLVAQLRAFLISGESFDLVPIEDEQDVKSAVESLLRNWADSGFLIHGRLIYPWHQVRHIEVMQVDKTLREYQEQGAAGRVRAQDEFWQTHRREQPSR